MQTDSFNLQKINDLFNNRGYDPETGNIKDFKDAKVYLTERLYPLNNGDYILNEKNKLRVINYEIASRTILNKLPDELKKWYLKKYFKIYEQVCKLKQPIIKDDEINTIGKFMHKDDRAYSSFSDDIHNKVNMMLSFYKELWCNNNDVSFNYIIRWMANMVQGIKNETILYLKSNLKGIGKSRGTTFLIDHVIGDELAMESPSTPLTSKYNSCLYGKLMVAFEELENTSKYEWESISKRLKTWTTSNKITIEEKYMTSFTSDNINNYLVLSNNDAIKGADGRRFYCLDLSSKRMGDTKYWDDLHSQCFNNEVGHAFYIYLKELDVSNFNCRVFEATKSKTDALTDLLNNVYKFVKFNYVMCDKDILLTSKELYNLYIEYCNKTSQNEFKKRKFISLLREVDIEYYTSNGKCIYNISIDKLKEIAQKFKWYYEDDREEFTDNCIWDDKNDLEALNPIDHDDRIIILKQENDKLKEIIKNLQEQLKQPKETVPPIEPEEPIKPKLKKVVKKSKVKEMVKDINKKTKEEVMQKKQNKGIKITITDMDILINDFDSI
jgi:hypothetical protein